MARYTLGLLGLGALVASCDYSGDFLFAGVVEGLPDIYELTAEDGGLLVPAVIDTIEELRAATIYAEIGPPSTTDFGGATFEFIGTGGEVCIWVDPEVAWWNQAVGPRNTINEKWTYPDNSFDDGDIDLSAGLSVYYTGSPSKIGDFVVAYEDSLGNDIPLSLAACPNTVGRNALDPDDATAGKGSAEYCTLDTTGAEGISHTVLLRTWSTPLDDDRLAFGLLLTEGSCDRLATIGGVSANATAPPPPIQAECLIQGEALLPEPLDGEPEDYKPYYGFSAAQPHMWPGSIDFEAAFCDTERRMQQFCRPELNAVTEAGKLCSWEDFDPASYDVEERCYCGDQNDTPEGGAF